MTGVPSRIAAGAAARLAGDVAGAMLDEAIAALAGGPGGVPSDLPVRVARRIAAVRLFGAVLAFRELRDKRVQIRPRSREAVPVATFAAEPAGLLTVPWGDAVASLVGEVPGLAELVAAIEADARESAGRYIEASRVRVRQAAEKALASLPEAVRIQRVTVGPEAIRSAVRAAIGEGDLRDLLQTESRTAAANAFVGGRVQFLRQHTDEVPLWRLSEIRDLRTRGNPNGLYADAGPHWQMDGFIATPNDPIWAIITPPNGWNCRGSIEPIEAPRAVRMGLAKVGPNGMVEVDREAIVSRFARQRGYVDRGEYPDPGFGA